MCTRTQGPHKRLSQTCLWMFEYLLQRHPGEGNSYPLQYSCLENPMDQGAWWATIHGVTKSQTLLSNFCVQRHRSAMACCRDRGSGCSRLGRYSMWAPLQSHWVNNPQTGEQLYQRSSCTVVKVLRPTTHFPTWGSKQRTGKVKLLSHVRLFATQCTVAHQAPLSMGFSRQE